jgi:hypothetical protein
MGYDRSIGGRGGWEAASCARWWNEACYGERERVGGYIIYVSCALARRTDIKSPSSQPWKLFFYLGLFRSPIGHLKPLLNLDLGGGFVSVP